MSSLGEDGSIRRGAHSPAHEKTCHYVVVVVLVALAGIAFYRVIFSDRACRPGQQTGAPQPEARKERAVAAKAEGLAAGRDAAADVEGLGAQRGR